jgi:hypothetical protein
MWSQYNALCTVLHSAPAASGLGNDNEVYGISTVTTYSNVPCMWAPDPGTEASIETGQVIVNSGTVTIPTVQGNGTAINADENARVTIGGVRYVVDGAWTQPDPNHQVRTARLRAAR